MEEGHRRGQDQVGVKNLRADALDDQSATISATKRSAGVRCAGGRGGALETAWSRPTAASIDASASESLSAGRGIAPTRSRFLVMAASVSGVVGPRRLGIASISKATSRPFAAM